MSNLPPCHRCGGQSIRWSGGDCWRGAPMKNVGALFICADCDPHSKWSNYAGEHIAQGPDGAWHEVPDDSNSQWAV